MASQHSDPEATQLLRKEIEAEVSRISRVSSYAATATMLGIGTIVALVASIFIIQTMSPLLWEYKGPRIVIMLGIILMFSAGSTVFFAVSAYYLSKESKPVQ
jgi:hypothetical protein